MPDLSFEDVFDVKATALPVAFDIVWCKYPHLQHGKEPGPIARPCLVYRAFTQEVPIKGKQHVVGWVEVVYGTKQVDKFDPPRGFHVNEDDLKKACGLTVDTVFDLSDRLILPWSPIYFSNDAGKPKISGAFTPAMKDQLKEQAKLLKSSAG